jgi:hypothetical protein
MIRTGRLPFVILAILSLIVGLLAGLQRIGWSLPVSEVSPSHGAIMVGGFLGTLITLEKVIPLKKNILYVIPLISGGSIILFIAGMLQYSLISLLIASVGLSIIFLIHWIQEQSVIYAMMLIGAVCWFIGNILLLKNNFYPASIPWWMTFALLLITSERLELMKFLPVSQAQKLIFMGVLLTFLLGCVFSFHGIGNYLSAVALVASSIWLMRHDMIAINVKKIGLLKYVGISLLTGYFALLMSGFFLLALTNQSLGYDILIHSFFIGFVFSMIFAHGPIILPGVLGISVKPFHTILYFWLVLLHASWIVRVFADTALNMHLRMYAGLISAIAIVGYFLSIATITIRAYRAQPV